MNQTQRSSLKGTLHLVDLAGSERLSRSNATGDRLKETVAINKSLSSLTDVFVSISNKNSHVRGRFRFVRVLALHVLSRGLVGLSFFIHILYIFCPVLEGFVLHLFAVFLVGGVACVEILAFSCGLARWLYRLSDSG